YLSQYSDPQRVRELLAAQERDATPGLDAQLADATKRLATLERDFLANLDLLKRGVLNEDEFSKANETRRAERVAVDARVADLKGRIEAERRRAEQADAIPQAVGSFLETFQSIDARQAKAKLQTILKAAYIYRDGRIELEFRV
ncbi:MAG: recombinase family protein, partial [Chloroflexota bacterium]|nr:recombinase family protein [Chloroflexota bacterium]